MIIQDNILKEYLKNIYFITGTPCGGKSTMSKVLAKKYGFDVYDVDEKFSEHKKLSNVKNQPAMNKIIRSADEFFLRPIKEYKQWLLDNTREQLDFIILDLIILSQNKKIVCDLHLTLEQAQQFANKSNIVFLIKEPKDLVEGYCNRSDHQGFKKFIESSSNVKLAKSNCSEVLEIINMKKYIDIKNSDFFWIERDENSTIENTLLELEKHFGLVLTNNKNCVKL